MKRTLSFLLAVFMTFILMPTATVHAEEEEWENPPAVSLTGSLSEDNKKLNLSVSVSDYAELSGMEFQVNYDSSILSNPQLGNLNEIFDGLNATSETEDGIIYLGSSMKNNSTGSAAELFSYTFDVAEGASGTVDISAGNFEFVTAVAGNRKISHKSGGKDEVVTPAVPVNIPATTLAITGLTAPAKGGTPVAYVTADKGSPSITWSPNDAVFKANTVYTATIVVSGGTAVTFADSVSTTVDGTAVESTVANNAVTVSVEFPKTAAKDLAGLSVSPATLNVEVGSDFEDVADKLTVTATFDDGSSSTVPFGTSGYSSSVSSFDEKEEGKDVTLSYTYGAITKTASLKVNVTGKSASAEYSGDAEITYDGTDHSSAIKEKVSVGGTAEEHGDVTVTITKDGQEAASVTEVGTYVVCFRVDGSGTVYDNPTTDTPIAEVKVVPADASNATVTPDEGPFVYDGTAKEPGVTVEYNQQNLEKDKDYTVEYSDNILAGPANIIISFINNFTGVINKIFNIGKRTVNAQDLAAIDPQTKIYDGTKAGNITSVNVVNTAAGDVIEVTGTSEYDSANAGEATKVVFTATGLSGEKSDNYKLADNLQIEIQGSITKADATDETNKNQNVVVGTGTFTKPSFKGVDGNTLEGKVTYRYQGAAATYEQIVDELKTLQKGETRAIEYGFEAENYNAVSGTINVTMVDILFDIQDGAITENPAAYGDKWSDIVKIDASKITATIDGQEVKGTYTVEEGTPAVGEQSYTVMFTTEDGKKYEVVTGQVTVEKRTITVEDLTEIEEQKKTYDGTTDCDLTSVSVKAGSVVEGDTVTVNGTAVYDEKNAGERTVTFTASSLDEASQANYKLADEVVVTASGVIDPFMLSKENLTAPDDMTREEAYDGTTGTGVTEAKEVTGIIAGDQVKASGEEAQMDKADAGENTATLVVTKTDNSNYAVPEGGIELTFKVTVNKADVEPKKEAEQTIPVGSKEFEEPEFIGVDGEEVSGTVEYSMDQETWMNYEEIGKAVSELPKSDEGVEIAFRFLSSDGNYNDSVSDENKIRLIVVGYEASDAEWYIGSKGTLTMVCTGVFDLFDAEQFTIDDKAVDGVVFEEGSTLAILPDKYLNKLRTGAHTVRFVYTNGEEATATLTVKKRRSHSDDDDSDDDDDSTPTRSGSGVVTCQDAGFPANYAWNEAAKACQPGYLDANGKFHGTAGARVSVVNTADPFNSFGWLTSLITNTVIAIAALTILKKWK